MKHLIVGSPILAIILSVGLARAFDEPAGFKGVRFGDSEQIVRSWLNPFRATDVLCGGHDHARVFGDRFCSGRSTIGDIPVGVMHIFRTDKLQTDLAAIAALLLQRGPKAAEDRK